MKRRLLLVIVLSTAINVTFVAVLGFRWHVDEDDECDVSARGLLIWSDNREQLGLPQDRWVTVEPAPEGAELPPCRVGSKTGTGQGEFLPV